jgi:hypothetical protein
MHLETTLSTGLQILTDPPETLTKNNENITEMRLDAAQDDGAVGLGTREGPAITYHEERADLTGDSPDGRRRLGDVAAHKSPPLHPRPLLSPDLEHVYPLGERKKTGAYQNTSKKCYGYSRIHIKRAHQSVT